MAYDALKRKKDGDSDLNPYDGLTSPDRAMVAPAGDPNRLSGAPLGARGPSSSGHVNFDQIYDANAGVSAREAGNRAAGVEAKAKTAQSELTGAQSKFDSALTGASTSPTQSQQAWGATGSTGVTQPKRVTGAYSTANGQSNWHPPPGTQRGDSTAIPGVFGGGVQQIESPAAGLATDATDGPQQSYESEEQEGFGSEGAGVTRDANGNVIAATGARDPAADAADEAAVRAGAAHDYTGPLALSGMDEYSKLTTDTAAAQDAANNPLTGMGQLDSSLLGAAGRPRFAQLQQQYGGLRGDLDKANVASAQRGQATKTKADQDRAAYQALLDQHEGRVGADTDAAAAANAHSDAVLGHAQADADARKRFDEYRNGGDAGDKIRNVLHGVARYTSPSELATGGKGLANMGTNTISAQGPDNKGNEWSGWTDDDYDAWASMSGADWDAFGGMSDSEKRQWIEERKKKLRGGA